MRIDPNMLPSFSHELPTVPPMSRAELKRAISKTHQALYSTHAEWLLHRDPTVLNRQMRLSMELERLLHRYRQPSGG